MGHTVKRASVAVILGSGLGDAFGSLEGQQDIPYKKLPNMPVSRVPGHPGIASFGRCGARDVLVFRGRVHFYEGYTMEQIVAPVRIAEECGVKTLIVTNAAGAVNPKFRAGDMMLITDHINLMGTNPLHGNFQGFPDMTRAYDPELRALALKQAKRLKFKLHQGVYAAMPGPCYETPAEVKMLRTLGADAVGMSTVPEVIFAVSRGMRVLGLSCITNAAASADGEALSHQEVIDIIKKCGARFAELIRGVLTSL